MSDQVKPSLSNLLYKLKARGQEFFLLSGDKKSAVSDFLSSHSLFSKQKSFSQKSPLQKAEILDSHSNTLMIGDGVNDALAFSKSDVSIAVHGSAEISLQSADVYLTDQDIMKVEDLFNLSQETLFIAKRNLWISSLYNTLGVSLALLGYISPLFAAVLMPISSLTVIALTLLGTPRMNDLIKQGAH